MRRRFSTMNGVATMLKAPARSPVAVSKARENSPALRTSRDGSAPCARRGLLDDIELGSGLPVVRVPQHGDARRTGVRLREQCQTLVALLRRRDADTGEVGAWLRQARDEPGGHRVGDDVEHDRDAFRRVLGNDCARRAGGDDQVHVEPDQLLRLAHEPFPARLAITVHEATRDASL